MNFDIKYFRWLSYIEGISLLLLFFVAMPLKYLAGLPQAVRVVGMAHGILFLVYVFALLNVALENRWGWKKSFFGFISSSIPFGFWWFDRQYLKKTEA